MKSKTKEETLPTSYSSSDDYCILLVLTINFISITYRNYLKPDRTEFDFFLFLFSGHMVVLNCFTLFRQLPPDGKSFTESFLRYMISGAAATILFGSAHQFSTTSMTLPFTLFSYAIGVIDAWCLVSLYLGHKDRTVIENKPLTLGPDNV